jgi:hypothetical protein
MDEFNHKPALGLIVISVIMVFMAILTDIYWLASLIGRPFPRSIPLPEEVARAFALPDIVGSLLMYLGAYGLLRRRLWAIFLTLLAIGMNFGSSLFFLSLTKARFLNILGPTLVFVLFTASYLWIRRDLFLREWKGKT